MKLIVIIIISFFLNAGACIFMTLKEIELEFEEKGMLIIVGTFIAWVLYENFLKKKK